MVFARVYCRLKQGDPAALEMSKANTGNRRKDAIAWYAQQFRDAGMDNESEALPRCVISLCFSPDWGCERAREDIAKVGTGRPPIRLRRRPRPACSRRATMRSVRILCSANSSSSIYRSHPAFLSISRRECAVEPLTSRTSVLARAGTFSDSRRSAQPSRPNSPRWVCACFERIGGRSIGERPRSDPNAT
jgi:hypothetical protein